MTKPMLERAAKVAAQITHLDEDLFVVKGMVKSSSGEPYRVEMDLRNGVYLCGCPQSRMSSARYCKHMVALLLEVKKSRA